MTALLEQGLRLVLARAKHASERPRVTLPVCQVGGGTRPGVDLDDSAALLDLLEGRP